MMSSSWRDVEFRDEAGDEHGADDEHGSGDERGVVTVEAVILAPFILMLFLFVSYAGMIGMAHIKVTRAVHDAARAATQVQTSDQARVIALQSLEMSLGKKQFGLCKVTELDVDAVGEQVINVDVGNVRVGVFCKMDISGLSLLTKTSPTFSAVGVDAVDEFRSRKVIPK